MQEHWYRVSRTANRVVWSRSNTALQGQSLSDFQVQQEASSFSDTWLESLVRNDHSLQGDLLTKLLGHGDRWRAALQPQSSPSWWHAAVIGTSHPHAAKSMTPFVVKLQDLFPVIAEDIAGFSPSVQALPCAKSHERSLEQSLLDKRVTCYGYYDHVIEERQLTVYGYLGLGGIVCKWHPTARRSRHRMWGLTDTAGSLDSGLLLAMRLCSIPGDSEDRLKVVQGWMVQQRKSLPQTRFAADLMQVRWYRVSRVAVRVVRMRASAALQGQSLSACQIQQEATSFGDTWWESLGDLIRRLLGHRDRWRAALQRQDPSWRHVAVNGVNHPHAGISMTPFVVELLEMLHKREPHERSLEQSLFNERITCYGYYDHVIKERQLTIHECLGTLDEQFANGILLLVDLVIAYGNYSTLSDLERDGPLALEQGQPWLWLNTCVIPCSAPLFYVRHPCKYRKTLTAAIFSHWLETCSHNNLALVYNASRSYMFHKWAVLGLLCVIG
eukprot:SM000021S06535  [mRNA]  locus=s21:986041:988042:- [translate_table: standard]